MRRLHAAGVGWVAALVAMNWAASAAWSQGIIVDRRARVPVARSYEIREVSVYGKVRDQVAEVQVSQTFHNPGSFQMEAEFLFPLPEEGAVQDFVLLVDGRELPGRLLPRDEARRIYEEIVRTKRDPALLEYMGRGLYRTSVFPIPPGADRKVTMRYTQLCKRDRDVVEFAYPLSTQKFTAKPIQRLVVELSIRSKEAIKSVYCPSDDASIRRHGDHEVDVRYEGRDVVPEHDFRLVTSLAEGAFSASMLSYRPSDSEDGYFLVLASPEVRPVDSRPLPKTVIFVIDRSGSMAGKKIEQARRTLKSVLNNLRDDDLFNIVAYDDRVESFRPELQRYDSGSRREAERFVENIREGGSTNIDEALRTALGMIRDRSRPNYVLFLTDGLPTAGEVNEQKIAEHTRRGNEQRARIFCFGVGYDVNARLLDRISGGNSGTSEYVKPDEDIEAHVGRFYSKMTSPVLTDIHLELAGIDINRAYPRDLPDLFEGGQLVVAGRYRQAGRTTIKITGKVGDERRSYEFPADLAGSYGGGSHDFVERLWAVRRVGDLIDQIDMNGANRELIDELVSLSRKYGLLTPYTSFLADENVPLHASLDHRSQAQVALESLREQSGELGVAQRDLKQQYMTAMRAPNQGQGANGPMGGGAGGRTMGGMAGGMGGMGGGVTAQMQLSKPNAAPGQQAQMGNAANAAGQRYGNTALRRGEAEKKTTFAATSPSEAQFPVSGLAAAKDAEDKAGASRPTVRQIGTKTFYFKNGRWVDSSVKPEEDAKAEKVVQFSEDYFKLARSQKAEYNQYFSQEEPITVKLDGRIYHIDPAPREPAR